jgi:hypothetical protein
MGASGTDGAEELHQKAALTGIVGPIALGGGVGRPIAGDGREGVRRLGAQSAASGRSRAAVDVLVGLRPARGAGSPVADVALVVGVERHRG